MEEEEGIGCHWDEGRHIFLGKPRKACHSPKESMSFPLFLDLLEVAHAFTVKFWTTLPSNALIASGMLETWILTSPLDDLGSFDDVYPTCNSSDEELNYVDDAPYLNVMHVLATPTHKLKWKTCFRITNEATSKNIFSTCSVSHLQWKEVPRPCSYRIHLIFIRALPHIYFFGVYPKHI